MKRFLAFIGAWLYAIFISMVLGTIFSYLTPWVINFSWVGLFLFFFIGSGVIFGIISSLSAWLMLPLLKMFSIWKHAKWMACLSFLINGLYYTVFPWRLDGPSYGFRQILLAVGLSISFICIYWPLFYSSLTYKKEGIIEL